MKNEGFTLIELLATIIIIGIMALITTPIVINIVNDVKRNSLKVGSYSILRAIELYTIKNHVTNEALDFNDKTKIDYKGKSPEDGSILVDSDGNVALAFYDNGFCATKSAAETVITVTVKTLDNCRIPVDGIEVDSVEDLLTLANEVNAGDNKAGLNYYLMRDLDFTSDASYVNPLTTTFGDVNGNTIIETLKVEMTTGAGYRPIGKCEYSAGPYDEIYFTGNFNGLYNTINNLMINRPTEVCGGLFGSTSGGAVISSVNLTNASIIGEQSIGGIVGNIDDYHNIYTGVKSTIKNNSFSGTINSVFFASNAGGIVGYMDQADVISNVVMVGSTIRGNDQTGGTVGYAEFSNITNNINNSTIITVDGEENGGIIGYAKNTIISGNSFGGSLGNSYQYAGGIIGHAIGASILNNTMSGTITSDGLMGGIVGKAENGNIITGNTVTATTVITSGHIFVGGIVGEAYNATILNNTTNGLITSHDCTGGIAGIISDTTMDNNVSNMTVNGSGYSDIGGIVGLLDGTATITNSISTGNVTGSYQVGGAVGRIRIFNSTIAIKIENVTVSGIIIGTTMDVGGIVGKIVSIGTPIIPFLKGNVSSATISSKDYIGGVVGSTTIPSLTLTNNITSGIINGCGTANVNGIYGYTAGSVTSTNNVTTTTINTTWPGC